MSKRNWVTASVLSVMLAGSFLGGQARAEGDAENGEQIFKQCRACHQVGATAKNLVGPVLNGVVGRKAGTYAEFKYSQASQDAGGKGLAWTEENLEKYLTNPQAFMPGTKMSFAGLSDEGDRQDVIAYLKTLK